MAKPLFTLETVDIEDGGSLNSALLISDERADEIVTIIDAAEIMLRDEDGSTDKIPLLQNVLLKCKNFNEATFVSLVLGGYFADCDRQRAMEEKTKSILGALKKALEKK